MATRTPSLRIFVRGVRHVVMLMLATATANATDSSQTRVAEGKGSDLGAVRVPSFILPLSSYMSDEAKRAFVERPPFALLDSADWPKLSQAERRRLVDSWYRPQVDRAKTVYPVSIKEQWIDGVRTDVVVPVDGVSDRNSERVLINLHGGGYSHATAGGMAGLAESIPVSGAARIKVISVDYRTSPQHVFPAATEDVITVYRYLLKSHDPGSVGIFGCSTGATLTATVIARLQKEGLPRPGAIGLFCDGATKDDQVEGDSYYVAPAMMGQAVPGPTEAYPEEPYMKGTNPRDPLVAPVVSLDVLARFPPTLLISGTRDSLLSAVVYTHSRLIKARVDADLHVWDGMWHNFFFDVDLPESKDAYDVITRFFDRHLRSGK